MKVHWLFKYYFVAFLFIFSVVYYIENSKPYVDWSLYPNISENEFKSLINKENCIELQKLYEDEYLLNYDKNTFGFMIRKDNQSKRGLNLLKLINYHIKDINCTKE